CDALGLTDRLVITADTGGPGTQIAIGDLFYVIGSTAATGGVEVTVAGGTCSPVDANGGDNWSSNLDDAPTGCSNATVATVDAFTSPVVQVEPATNDQPVGTVSVVEHKPGAIAAGFVCVTLTSGGVFSAGAPTIDSFGGGAV